MKKISLRISAAFMCICLIASVFASCAKTDGNNDKSEKLSVNDLAVIHETEFGGIYLDITIDDFNALGFKYGDDVLVKLTTDGGSYELEVPYYNGYYTQTGEPILVAYPGYPHLKVCINNGDDLWDIAGVDENSKAEITLKESGKYKDIQDARDIHYTDERGDYKGDEVFANFRSISVSTMKEDVIYRSASPCDNQHNRATYVNDLIKAAGVKYIINLADDDEKIKGYISDKDFGCDYFLSLYNDGKVLPLAMNMNFGSDEFKKKTAKGLCAIAENDGPYLVHCTEGKDRTGFMCMLIEALSGASYDEIVEDYMITYDNYYDINEISDKKRYDVIVENVLNPMIRSLSSEKIDDLKKADLSICAESYLLSAGMSAEQIEAVKAKIIK